MHAHTKDSDEPGDVARIAADGRTRRLRAFCRDDRGATLLEYIVIAGLIAIVAFVGVRTFGSSLLAAGSGQAKSVLCIPGEIGGGASGGCDGAGDVGPAADNGDCIGGLCLNGNCFVAGTPVATADGSRPIEQIRVGDWVLARDEASGEVAPSRVARTFVTRNMAVIDVRIREAPGGDIRATAGHRFWTVDRGWVEASELTLGEALLDVRGRPVHVDGMASEAAAETVFNFEVADVHSYFVGAARVLVHNPTGEQPCAGHPNPVHASRSHRR